MKIKENVFYVGVNDRQKSLFEGLWPLPYGVSYNSYVVVDDKIALIDTVDICYFERYLSAIKSVIGERSIDYLVINHMEPDHSGSIRLIKAEYPNITIIGNKKTMDMVQGFHGITDGVLEVSDKCIVPLGNTTLEFFMTPMVHWPETMMTYCPEQKVLFSGDGFGSFGTLDGAVMDSDMNIEHYWDEMRRYYSNIVGKYGSPVQKALQKLSGLCIERICSTHGPVWADNIPKVISLYDQWSKYEASTGAVVAYASMYGNTELMAEAVAKGIAKAGVRDVVLHNLSKSHPSFVISDIFRYKGLVIGSPTYSNELFPEVKALLGKIETRDIKNRYFSYFGSYSWAGAAVKQLHTFAEKMKFDTVGEPVENKQSPSSATLAACEALGLQMGQRLLADEKEKR